MIPLCPKTGIGYTYKWEAVTPSISVGLLRPEIDRPLGLNLVASYTTVNFTGTQSTRLGGDSIALGVDAYLASEQSANLTIFPTIGLAYARVNSWYNPGEDLPGYDETVSSVLIGFELDFLIEKKFIIAPSITIFDGSTAVAFTVGLALPQNW